MRIIIISIFVFATTVWLVGIYGGFTPIPFKVTDPSDPKFKIENFRFEDYRGRGALNNALQIMFPKGVPLSEVDRILVTKARAQKEGPSVTADKFPDIYKKSESNKVFRYRKWTLLRHYLQVRYLGPSPTEQQIVVDVEVDAESKLVEIYAR